MPQVSGWRPFAPKRPNPRCQAGGRTPPGAHGCPPFDAPPVPVHNASAKFPLPARAPNLKARTPMSKAPAKPATKTATPKGKSANTLKIAVIPGDGIGNEVVPEGIKVLEAVGRKFDIACKWDHFGWYARPTRRPAR